MTTPNNPPKPTQAELTRSLALIDCIRDAMTKAGGAITFAEFMSMVLYHPQYGYYNSPAFSLGKSGDFTTAPEISPLFARCFARQCEQVLSALSDGNLLELGAGSGVFAGDLINELNQLGKLPTHYFIYEISPALRAKQQAHLQSHYPALFNRFIWLDALPSNFNGVIIANEVLDALPVNRFRVENGAIKECCVTWKEDHFTWQLTNASNDLKKIAQALVNQYPLQNGYESEIHLYLRDFMTKLANSLQTGVILLADYGYGQREYYHPERKQGTLTCFYKHHHHANPFALPGLQDITAHVDFTTVIDVAYDHGCELLGFTTQSAFLFACGLMTLAATEEKKLAGNSAEEFALHQAIKLLTLPTEMGDVIKVMALGKQFEMPLIGFTQQDRRRDL